MSEHREACRYLGMFDGARGWTAMELWVLALVDRISEIYICFFL